MKKLIVLLSIVGLAATVSAQKDPVSAVFDKYEGQKGFTTVNITGDMLNMIGQAQAASHDSVFHSKLTDMRILAREKSCDDTPAIDLKSEVYDKINKKDYKEMMSVKESDEDVVILVKEANGHISEFLLIVSGKKDAALIQAKGDIVLSDMASMAGKFNMEGMDQLKKMH